MLIDDINGKPCPTVTFKIEMKNEKQNCQIHFHSSQLMA